MRLTVWLLAPTAAAAAAAWVMGVSTPPAPRARLCALDAFWLWLLLPAEVG